MAWVVPAPRIVDTDTSRSAPRHRSGNRDAGLIAWRSAARVGSQFRSGLSFPRHDGSGRTGEIGGVVGPRSAVPVEPDSGLGGLPEGLDPARVAGHYGQL